MTNEEILQKAIDKAIKNGLKERDLRRFLDIDESWDFAIFKKLHYSIIFSHDFAKCFWGEYSVCGSCGEKWEEACWCDRADVACIGEIKNWQYHLQQLVILTDDEKFKYLEKYLWTK